MCNDLEVSFATLGIFLGYSSDAFNAMLHVCIAPDREHASSGVSVLALRDRGRALRCLGFWLRASTSCYTAWQSLVLHLVS